LKVLAGVIEADPYYLKNREVEKAVRGRLLDWSICVREAAVDLLGRYMVADAELSRKYCRAILDRIKDKGPLVRRKVVKVLANICLTDMSYDRISEMLTELVKRVNDNTELIKNAVTRTFEKIWFVMESNMSALFLDLVRNTFNKQQLVDLFKLLQSRGSQYSLSTIKKDLIDRIIVSDNAEEVKFLAQGLEIACEVDS
jgi:hypothetical protein